MSLKSGVLSMQRKAPLKSLDTNAVQPLVTAQLQFKVAIHLNSWDDIA